MAEIQFNDLIRNGRATIDLGDIVPSVDGFTANVGALGMTQNNQLWVKTGESDMSWKNISTYSILSPIPQINWANGDIFFGELTYNTNMTFQNIIVGKTIKLFLTNGAGWGVNYPSEIRWVGGSSAGNPVVGQYKYIEFTAITESLVVGNYYGEVDLS